MPLVPTTGSTMKAAIVCGPSYRITRSVSRSSSSTGRGPASPHGCVSGIHPHPSWIKALEKIPKIPNRSSDEPGPGVRVIHAADLMFFVQLRQRFHLRPVFFQPLCDALVRRIGEPSPAIVVDPQLAGCLQNGIGMRRVDTHDVAGDHRHLQACAMDRLHGCGKILFYSLGQNVTSGANRDVNSIEPDISGDRGRIADAGPLQVFGEDANLQLPRPGCGIGGSVQSREFLWQTPAMRWTWQLPSATCAATSYLVTNRWSFCCHPFCRDLRRWQAEAQEYRAGRYGDELLAIHGKRHG